VGFWKTARNYFLMGIARHAPSLRFKAWLYRRMGARVDRRACVGLEVTFDIFFAELISIGPDATVGYATTILCHEFLRREWRTGPVRIEKDAVIGANCTILPGVVVGEGATVSAMSLVNRDIPAGEFWGGVPVRPLQPRGAPKDSK
jgi:acetyltransferase-like isoleucine patch superfamily enzyme